MCQQAIDNDPLSSCDSECKIKISISQPLQYSKSASPFCRSYKKESGIKIYTNTPSDVNIFASNFVPSAYMCQQATDNDPLSLS